MTSNFDARQLTDLQSCPRKYVLANQWRPRRWNPKYLHDALLRQAIIAHSNGAKLEQARADAKAQFLQSAANPGIDVKGNPYPIAMEWAALLEVLITSMNYMGVPSGLRTGPTVEVGLSLWDVTAQIDSMGRLHRYITTDYFDQAKQEHEVRSWWVAGDVAVTSRQLVLHVFDIGQMRSGGRASLWVRGWRNPKLPNVRKIKFKLSEGKSFRGWTPVRLADNPDMDVDRWTDWVWESGAGREMVHTIEVLPTDPVARSETLMDIQQEVAHARALDPVPWSALPMHRGACDQCQFRPVCYGGMRDEDIGKSILYVRRHSSNATDEAGVLNSRKVL